MAAKSAKGANADNAQREEQRRNNLLTQVRAMVARGDDSGAENFVQSISSNEASEALRNACQSLAPQLRKEKTEKEEALNNEAEAEVRQACDLLFKISDPKELDDSRQSLARWLEKRGDMPPMEVSNPRNERTRKSVQGALSFVTRWQDYLAARAAGTDERMLNETLRSLANNADTGVNLPLQRSAILALIRPTRAERPNPTPTAARTSAAEVSVALNAALDRAKTLDDLPTVIRDVQVIRDEQAGGYNGTNANDLNAALAALQTYHQTYLEFRAGLRTSLDMMSNRYDISTRISGGIESHLVALRAQLVALELPRLLGAATEKPAPGESLDLFWRRLVDAAKKRGD